MKIYQYVLISSIIYISTVKACENDIIACNMDLLSTNKQSNQIVGNLTSNMSLGYELGWSSCRLFAETEKIHQWALEFEKNTFGKGNIVTKLAKKIREQFDIELSQKAKMLMTAMGTEPIIKKSRIKKLESILNHGKRIIGFSNQDRLEHEIYTKKMINQKKTFNELFAALVIIPTYEDEEKFNPDGYRKDSDFPPQYSAKTPYPSQEFFSAIYGAAQELGSFDPKSIPIITTKDQLNLMANSGK